MSQAVLSLLVVLSTFAEGSSSFPPTSLSLRASLPSSVNRRLQDDGDNATFEITTAGPDKVFNLGGGGEAQATTNAFPDSGNEVHQKWWESVAGTVAESASTAAEACSACKAVADSKCGAEDDGDVPFVARCFVSKGPGTTGADWEEGVIGLSGRTQATADQFSYMCAENLPTDENQRSLMTPSNKWICEGDEAVVGSSGRDWQHLPSQKQFNAIDADIEAWGTSVKALLAGSEEQVEVDGEMVDKWVYTDADYNDKYAAKVKELNEMLGNKNIPEIDPLSDEIKAEIATAEAGLRTAFGIGYENEGEENEKPIQLAEVGDEAARNDAVAAMKAAIAKRTAFRADQKAKREEIAVQHHEGWTKTQAMYEEWKGVNKDELKVSNDFVGGLSNDFIADSSNEEEENKLTPANFLEKRAEWRKALLAALAADLAEPSFQL